MQLSERQGAERAQLRPEPSAGPKKRAGERAKGAIVGARQVGAPTWVGPSPHPHPSPGQQRVSAVAGPQRPGAPRRERAEAGRESGREGKGRGRGRERSPSRGRGAVGARTDPLSGSEPGHRKLCPGGESGVRGGRRKLVSGRGAPGIGASAGGWRLSLRLLCVTSGPRPAWAAGSERGCAGGWP